jgi:hypothetical protein
LFALTAPSNRQFLLDLAVERSAWGRRSTSLTAAGAGTARPRRAAPGRVGAESLDGACERARLIAQAKPAQVNFRLRVRAPVREQGSGV